MSSHVDGHGRITVSTTSTPDAPWVYIETKSVGDATITKEMRSGYAETGAPCRIEFASGFMCGFSVAAVLATAALIYLAS